jgi:hypothetical protein
MRSILLPVLAIMLAPAVALGWSINLDATATDGSSVIEFDPAVDPYIEVKVILSSDYEVANPDYPGSGPETLGLDGVQFQISTGSSAGDADWQFDATSPRTHGSAFTAQDYLGYVEQNIGSATNLATLNSMGAEVYFIEDDYLYPAQEAWVATYRLKLDTSQPQGSYDFSVTADPNGLQNNPAGYDLAEGYSTSTTLTVNVAGVCTSPVITAAESIKTHGSVGDFGIDILDEDAVEPRFGGPDRIEVTFDYPIQAVDGSMDAGQEVVLSDGSIASLNVTDNVLSIYTNNDFTNNSCLEVTLNGISLQGDPGCLMEPATEVLQVALVTGDINMTGGVTTTDIAYVKYYSGQTPTEDNFTCDIYVDGGITSTDVAYAKAFSGSGASCP